MKDTVEAAGLLDSLLGFLKDALNALTQAGIDYEEDLQAKKKAEETEAKKAKAEGRAPKKIISQFYTIEVVDEEAGTDAEGNKQTKDVARLMLTPTTKNTFYATLTFNDGAVRRNEQPMTQDDLTKWIQKTLAKFGYDTYEDVRKAKQQAFNISTEDVEESTHIKATLRKVESDTDISVELEAIDPVISSEHASEILDSIICDKEFVEQLTDEPHTYDIIELDDSYEICEE